MLPRKREIFIMSWQVMMPGKTHLRTKLLMKKIEGD
jgi:hypothetical protein